MQAKTTKDSDEKTSEMIRANASLVSELDTVPMAGARIFALLLSTFSSE